MIEGPETSQRGQVRVYSSLILQRSGEVRSCSSIDFIRIIRIWIIRDYSRIINIYMYGTRSTRSLAVLPSGLETFARMERKH